MRNNQCRIAEYEVPIVGVTLHVVQANDVAPAWDALFPNAPKANPNAYGLAWFDCEEMTGYVGLKTFVTAQTIAHEALHITHDILRTIGHQPSYENNEIECYLLGYIVHLITPEKGEKLKPYPKK
jgi:hypothetical protein